MVDQTSTDHNSEANISENMDVDLSESGNHGTENRLEIETFKEIIEQVLDSLGNLISFVTTLNNFSNDLFCADAVNKSNHEQDANHISNATSSK